MNQHEIFLCAPVLTAMGTFGGALKDVPADELGAVVVREALSRAGLSVEQGALVVVGNVIQAGNRMNPAL